MISYFQHLIAPMHSILKSTGTTLLLTASLLQGQNSESFSDRFDAIWEAATAEQRYKLLYDLPKGGDIHNHLGGSNRPEWVLEVTQNPELNGGDVFWTRLNFASPPDAISPKAFANTIRQFTYDTLPPEVQAEFVRMDQLTPEQEKVWCDAFRLESEGEGRDEFFDVIWSRFGTFFTSPQIQLEMLAYNIKAFSAEGLSYWEPQYGGPGSMRRNDGELIPLEEGMQLLEARLAEPDLAETGMVVRFQKTIYRLAPDAEERTRQHYAFVDAHRDRWVALNMAGIEEDGKGYPERFLEVLRELRSTYPDIPLSFHAGEMDGPDKHIRETLLLGANRIGHGVNILKDPDTLLLLQLTKSILIEINLISNQLLEYVEDIRTHPFPELLRTGVPVCLNTDDRGMWDSNMTDEYFTAMKWFHLSWDELTVLAHNSLEFAFVEAPIKAKLIENYWERIEAYKAKYSEGSIEDALAKVDVVDAVTYGYAEREWGLRFD